MAEITPVTSLAGKEGQVLWETVACSDTGALQDMTEYSDNTVTVTGTFNSQTVTLLGSNDGTNTFTLTDNNGLPLTFTSAGGKLIAESPKYIGLSFSGAAGGDVDVIIKARKS